MDKFVFPISDHSLMVYGKPEIVYNSFIEVNGKPVVKATFDLSNCPMELINDMVRILEHSGMKLCRNV